MRCSLQTILFNTISCFMKSFYITTAIDYANGPPHLGHAYEKVLTDVIARYKRLVGNSVYFLTGIDEHGQKVTQTAAKLGKSPEELTNEVAPQFVNLCKQLLISNDDFIRTSEERHKEVVRQILEKLHEKGDIYQADYQGFYSVRQEQFVTEKEKEADGSWPELFGEVVEISETNYFFKLGQYQDWLIQYLEENPDFIFPRFRQKQVLEFLKNPINDLCITRPVERLSWGIPLPFDPRFVTYVWFDALINYISAVGYGKKSFETYWPADYHVIGKDILVPSHSVYWPIMLKAAGLPIPKHLLIHGWWLQRGSKMSKSTGEVLDPLDLVEQFGPDAFRYFVIREMNVGQDSDFSLDLFLSRYNDDLGNDLGNLVSRLLNMGSRYCGGSVPEAGEAEEPEKELQQLWAAIWPEVLESYEGFQFHVALEKTFHFIKAINRYAEIRAPWKLAKSEAPEDQARLKTSLASMGEGLRLASCLLAPVMPATSDRILGLLDEKPIPAFNEKTLTWGNRLSGNTLGEKTILFPRPG